MGEVSLQFRDVQRIERFERTKPNAIFAPTDAVSEQHREAGAPYPLSACVASSRHLAKMSTLACRKDLKISSQLDFF